MFYLYSDQQEVDLSDDNVFQMISVIEKWTKSLLKNKLEKSLCLSRDSLAFVVFKLDMEAVLDPHFHLYRIIHVRIRAQRVYDEF